MLTLGIETSCDETSVSVTSANRVFSNVVTSSVRLHKRYGGIVPEIASRYHVEYIIEVLSKALEKSGKALKDIKLVAVTARPGLVGALLIGVSLAKSISYSLKVPLIGVNHIIAHLYSTFLNPKDSRPDFPFIGLVVSGGHTALFYCENIERFKLLGQTQDDAVGEAYDKVAKILKLGYPGGPVIEKRARLSKKTSALIFPKSYMGKDSLDFSFSGIKTAVLYYVKNHRKLEASTFAKASADRRSSKLESGLVNDVCYAFQEAALDTLVEKAFLAVRLKGVKSIVVGGGVTANSRLREKYNEAAGFSGGVKVYFPEMKYTTDNAAMVGAIGEELYRRGHRSDLYLTAEPNFTT